MHHLCTSPEGLPYFYDIPVHVKPWQGSSRCVELNHTLRCLCGPPSIPLSFSLAAVLPRRDTQRVSGDRDGVETASIWYPSFTARTTGVSNSVRSPGFRASASGSAQPAAFATGVLPDLNAFHRYSGRSTGPYRPPRAPVSAALPRVSRGLSPPTQRPAYARFTPSNSGQRSPPTYYRGCWHVVSRGLFPGYRPRSPPGKAVYTPTGSVPHAASLDQ